MLNAPFIPCGQTFDSELDLAYGYLKYDGSIATNFTALRDYLGYGGDELDTVPMLIAGFSLQLGLVYPIDKFAAFFASLNSLVNDAIATISAVVDTFTTINPSIGFTIPFDANHFKVTSPFGEGNSIPLYSMQLSEDDPSLTPQSQNYKASLRTTRWLRSLRHDSMFGVWIAV